ncbi:MAG: DUF2760 domain-containing protein [Acidobacteriota bacterium]
MTTLGLAFRTFFKIFRDPEYAERIQALDSDTEAAPELAAAKPVELVDQRDSAVTLLATLQREARFMDFVMESLDGYDDAQVGAASRDIQRDLGKVVRRIFAPQPLAEQPEGSQLTVPKGFDPARFRLTGDLAGEPPYHGRLQHHGWLATQCEMPAWSGDDGSAMVVAPSEVEVGS